MAIRKIDEIVKMGSHPLEEFFDVEKNSTEIIVTERKTELTTYEVYDDKDKEIESDYQMIMDKALDLVDRIKTHIDEGAEAKFLARLSEVAGQNLNLALSAAEKKAKLKDNKDKFNHKKNVDTKKTSGNTTNNTIVVMDRNEMLKRIIDEGIIDGEIIENNKDNE